MQRQNTGAGILSAIPKPVNIILKPAIITAICSHASHPASCFFFLMKIAPGLRNLSSPQNKNIIDDLNSRSGNLCFLNKIFMDRHQHPLFIYQLFKCFFSISFKFLIIKFLGPKSTIN